MEMSNYLTPEEKDQMEELMKKAAERRKKNVGAGDGSMSFIFWQFQYESKNQADGEDAKKKAGFETELKALMNRACKFCQRHGYCEDNIKCRIYDDDDEELPFDIPTGSDECSDKKAEFQRQYEVGRMSMIFELVDKGRLSIDEAAELTGMTWGEAEDMLRGWQLAQGM